MMDERIDPLEVLPPEICLRIFDFLNPEDLSRCLAVNHQWRSIANIEKYWHCFCKIRGLEQSPIEGDYELLPLCDSASTYINYMNKLISNWTECRFNSFQLHKEDWCCCIAGYRRTLAVYYPRTSNVHIYHISNSIDVMCNIQLSLPYGISIPDVFLNEHFLIVTKGNVVIIYKHNDTFPLYKVIVGHEFGLNISTNLFPLNENEKRLYIKVISKNAIWMESDSAVYVADIVSNTYRVLTDTFRCLRVQENLIYAANDVVSCYNVKGDKLFSLKIKCVEDMWIRDKVLVVLNGMVSNQELQVWNLHSKSMRCVIKVYKDPACAISCDTDHLFVLEIIEDLYTVACFSTQTGILQWTYEHVFGREMSIHPEIRVVCDRFIFARPSHTCDKNFILLSSKTGKILYESMMPPCLLPPCYIYHLSDEYFVTAESNVIHIRSYL